MIIVAWLPIAAAAASLGGQIYGGIQSRKNLKDTLEHREKLADRQYRRQKENIEEMKKYNTPKAQMERFRKAGLNPNLIYTQGGPGNQSHFADYQPYDVDYSSRKPYVQDATAPLEAYQSTKSQQSQNRILDAEADVREKIRASGIDYRKARREVGLLDEKISTTFEQGQLYSNQIDKIVTEEELTELKKAYQITKNGLADEGVNLESQDIWQMMLRILMQSYGEEWYMGPSHQDSK